MIARLHDNTYGQRYQSAWSWVYSGASKTAHGKMRKNTNTAVDFTKSATIRMSIQPASEAGGWVITNTAGDHSSSCGRTGITLLWAIFPFLSSFLDGFPICSSSSFTIDFICTGKERPHLVRERPLQCGEGHAWMVLYRMEPADEEFGL